MAGGAFVWRFPDWAARLASRRGSGHASGGTDIRAAAARHSMMRFFIRASGFLLLALCLLAPPGAVYAQAPAAAPPPDEIAVGAGTPGDADIARRIEEIFAQLPELGAVDVEVRSGVVALSGAAATGAAIEQAGDIAGRVDGVVAVRNQIARDTRLSSRVNPAVETLNTRSREAIAAAPLIGAALLIVLIAILLGWAVRRFGGLWRRVTPNPFVAELASGAAQFLIVGLGVVIALMVLDATALLTAALGAAGVLGLAVGFAVRDVIENYLASVLLSVRQPFRPNDLVQINGQEGRVVRLTSRATILLTVQGNHLRIPNADVFKATILNYTRNPERRFDFDLGVGAEDDPIQAIAEAERVMAGLSFVLKAPPPGGRIKNVGDSNIVIEFWGWIDQGRSDFHKSRSLAIAAVKAHLEENGFALPEPIYRVLMQGGSGLPQAPAPEASAPARAAPRQFTVVEETAPDASLDRFVEEERSDAAEEDLLSEHSPTE